MTLRRSILSVLAVGLVLALAVTLGAYRDAEASSRQKAETIGQLSAELNRLNMAVGQLRTRVISDESRLRDDGFSLGLVQRKVDALCLRGHVVTDASVFNGALSTSLAYC